MTEATKPLKNSGSLRNVLPTSHMRSLLMDTSAPKLERKVADRLWPYLIGASINPNSDLQEPS